MYYSYYKDANGDWRWRLRAANNRIIANSGEGYRNKADCQAAVQLVKSSGNTPEKDE
jgi:uncharacterized protein YegP (UPF0339 family)